MNLRRRLTMSFTALALAVPGIAEAQQPAPPEPQPAQTQPTEPPPPPPPPAQPGEKTIRPGYGAGGVDLGGQTLEAAAETLRVAFADRFARRITVKAGKRRFRLDPATDAKLVFDIGLTVKRAYYAGLRNDPVRDAALAVTFKKRAVQRWANGVDREMSIKPRNARLKITLRHMVTRRAKKGRTINEISLARRLNLTLVDLSRPRTLRSTINVDRPDVTKRTLRHRYRTVVTVDRDNLRLRLFKRLKIAKRYSIAIGAAGFDTPTGLFNIQSKQVNPTWNVPNSAWAGSLAGQSIPGGDPRNPLKARWLGVNGSVGIHGTAEAWSIGTRASHGCIRMHVSDVIDLYPRVPLGTPVLIR
jgi:lipoprotein-anchoring transpeptidase ErfK/SrfK